MCSVGSVCASTLPRGRFCIMFLPSPPLFWRSPTNSSLSIHIKASRKWHDITFWRAIHGETYVWAEDPSFPGPFFDTPHQALHLRSETWNARYPQGSVDSHTLFTPRARPGTITCEFIAAVFILLKITTLWDFHLCLLWSHFLHSSSFLSGRWSGFMSLVEPIRCSQSVFWPSCKKGSNSSGEWPSSYWALVVEDLEVLSQSIPFWCWDLWTLMDFTLAYFSHLRAHLSLMQCFLCDSFFLHEHV